MSIESKIESLRVNWRSKGSRWRQRKRWMDNCASRVHSIYLRHPRAKNTIVAEARNLSREVVYRRSTGCTCSIFACDALIDRDHTNGPRVRINNASLSNRSRSHFSSLPPPTRSCLSTTLLPPTTTFISIIAMAPKPASTAGKAPASTASKAPAKTTESKAAKKTSKPAPADGEGKKKRRKGRKETYSSYIYKGQCSNSHSNDFATHRDPI